MHKALHVSSIHLIHSRQVIKLEKNAHARARRSTFVTGGHLKIPNVDFRASFHAVQTTIFLVLFYKLGDSVLWGCKWIIQTFQKAVSNLCANNSRHPFVTVKIWPLIDKLNGCLWETSIFESLNGKMTVPPPLLYQEPVQNYTNCCWASGFKWL